MFGQLPILSPTIEVTYRVLSFIVFYTLSDLYHLSDASTDDWKAAGCGYTCHFSNISAKP